MSEPEKLQDQVGSSEPKRPTETEHQATGVIRQQLTQLRPLTISKRRRTEHHEDALLSEEQLFAATQEESHGTRTLLCKRCTKEGHTSSQCNNPRVFHCWDCGQRHRRTTDCCRHLPEGDTHAINKNPTHYPTMPLGIKCHRITATIALGRELFEATIDTAATRSFASDLIANEVGTPQNLRQINKPVRLADGTIRLLTEELWTSIRLGDRTHDISLLVLPDTIDHLILGLDFLCQAGATLSLGEYTLTLGRPNATEATGLMPICTATHSETPPNTQQQAEPATSTNINAQQAASNVSTMPQQTTSITSKSHEEPIAHSSAEFSAGQHDDSSTSEVCLGWFLESEEIATQIPALTDAPTQAADIDIPDIAVQLDVNSNLSDTQWNQPQRGSLQVEPQWPPELIAKITEADARRKRGKQARFRTRINDTYYTVNISRSGNVRISLVPRSRKGVRHSDAIRDFQSVTF